MPDGVSTWDALHRLAGELELTIHLGSDVPDPWAAIQPRIAKLERWFERSQARDDAAELAVLASVVRKLRHDRAHRAN